MSLEEPSKDVFDPLKNYKRLRFIGDRDFQDFEGIELQQILDEERTRLFDRVFVDGSIVAESGGTIAKATQGVATGNVVALSDGTYHGFFTQIYTLKVLVGGTVGARITITSDGEDNGIENGGFEITIGVGDPLDGTVFYPVGTKGVTVAFLDTKPIKNLVIADSWVILATYSRRLPTVDAVASTITPTTISVYADGRLLFVPSATLSYPSAIIGKNVVFVEVLKDIVTGDADPTIKAALTNLNVAERERVVAAFSNRDTSADVLPAAAIWRKVFPVYLWNRATNVVERATQRSIKFNLDEIPGQLPAASLADLDFNEQLKGDFAEIINDITGGSYRITGLQAKLSTNTPPTDQALVTVERGKARISGLRIIKTAEEDVAIDRALDAKGVLDEAKTFSTGTNVYALNKAVGANKLPIKQITAVAAIVQVSRNITKGATNGLDPLPDQPVQSIVSVIQGATTYTPTTDYVLNGNFVDWSPGGIEPTSGTSYTVVYRYTKQMVVTTDYLLIDNDSDGDFDSIDFSPAGDNPVNATIFFINYDYYQPRIDLIFLRTDGAFQVAKGTPADVPSEPQPPTEFLGVAFVRLAGGADGVIEISNLDNIRVTMANMRNAIRRQELSFRNDALQDILNQTKLRQTVAYKGIFADAFALDDIADLFFDKPGGAGGNAPGTQVTFDALIDYFAFLLSLPINATNAGLAKNDALIPSGQVASKFNRDFVTLPFNEVAEIIQDQWSEQLNINPFASFQPPPALMQIVPDKDVGINETISTITDLWIQDSHGLYHAAEGLSPDELAEQLQLALSQHSRRGQASISSVSREETSRLVNERGGLFMRQVVVTITASRFVPGEDNIEARFDGKLVVLTPISPTVAGTLGGTVKAAPSVYDVNNVLVSLGGGWSATFTIPADVPSGIRTLVVTGGSGTVATAAYEGNFIQRQISIFLRETDVIPFDPLAQTFAFSQPTCVTRIRIPFAAKPDVSNPALMSFFMELQLRGVALPGGFPNQNIFESIGRDALGINSGPISINDFVFGNPMLQVANEFRAITLLSSSNDFDVYVATLGHAGLNPVAFISENPNVRGSEPPGILLQSLNALNWEAASKSSLRFSLYRAEFAAESWVYFDRIGSVNFSQLYLGIDQVVPEGTSITWQVSTDGLTIGNPGKVWREIQPLRTLDLGAIATTVDVRVKLATTNSRVSPYINFKNWHMVGFLYKSAGKYISARADMLQDITAVKIYVEANRPSVTTTNFFASNAEDVSGNPIWETVTTVDADVDLGDGFHELSLSKTFNNGIAQKQSFRKVRVRIDESTSNQAITQLFRKLGASFS